jgi:hypothetical protein
MSSASASLAIQADQRKRYLGVRVQCILTRLTMGEAIAVGKQKLRVFVSHAAFDRVTVETFGKRLRKDGFEPWLFEHKLSGGEIWTDSISRAVRTSHAVVICVSRRSIQKRDGYLDTEIREVLQVADSKPEGFVIPLRLEDCRVPASLRHLQWESLFTSDGYEHLRTLLRARATELGPVRSAAPQPPPTKRSVARSGSAQPRLLTQEQMYERMAESLDELRPDQVLVTSFQPHNPEREGAPEMVRYHQRLRRYLHENPRARLNRIVAVHTVEKIHWLARVIRDYDSSPASVSVRVLRCPNDFAEEGMSALPAIVQIFGERVFLSYPHARDGDPCVELEDAAFARFWRTYFAGLWEACGKDEVLRNSQTVESNLKRIVFSRISKLTRYLIRNGTGLLQPDALLRKIEEATSAFSNIWFEGGRTEPDNRPYGRNRLGKDDRFEIMVAYWRGREGCLPHDHGGSHGVMKVIHGRAEIQQYRIRNGGSKKPVIERSGKPDRLDVESEPCYIEPDMIHAMRPVQKGLVTLHIYTRPIPWMTVYDLKRRRSIQVSAACGAWWPDRPSERKKGAKESTFEVVP